MKTIAAFVIVLLAALFSVNADKHFPRRYQEGDLEEQSARPACGRCPLPTRRERVCAFNGLRYRTFLSECAMLRKECVTGRNFTIVSMGHCPRPASQRDGDDSDSDSDSEEDERDENNENGGGVESTSVAPVATVTTMPTQSPTPQRTISVSGRATFSLPDVSGATGPTASGTPAQTSGRATPAAGGSTAGVNGQATPAASGSTARQCNPINSCPPSSSVCGTDGVTYASQCVLEVTACVNRLDTLTVAYAGVCAP